MGKKASFIVFLFFVIFLVLYSLSVYKALPRFLPAPTAIATFSPNPIATLSPALGKMTKTENCLVLNSLPDISCTPGDILPVTKDEICQPGYSKKVRNVTNATKEKTYQMYNITSHYAGEYEVDHLISLELGGSNDISNLWPESKLTKPGADEKDQVENYLHKEVCGGRITLQDAQQKIATNWVEVYTSMAR